MAQLLSDEILEMTLQSLEIEDKRSVRLVCKRFKRVVDWSIKIYIVLGKTNSSTTSSSSSSSSISVSATPIDRRRKDAELYLPSKYQYVTCISIAGERKELQKPLKSSSSSSTCESESKSKSPISILNSEKLDVFYQFPIKFEPLSLFSHCNLRRLVIGQGVSGISSVFISKILRYSCKNLEKLGWNIDVSETKRRNSSQSENFSTSSNATTTTAESQSQKQTKTPCSFIKELDFKNLTELSLKFVQKPGRGENTKTFLSLLQNSFPKLYSLSLFLISEPIAIFSVRKSKAQLVESASCSEKANENVQTNSSCDFQYEDSWPVYFETFHFISRHRRNLRVVELDYSHLHLSVEEDLDSSESPEKDSKDKRENLENVQKVKDALTDLELHTLDLVCPKMEGISPWTFCSSLLSSQRHLTELMLKTRGNPHLLSVNSTFCQNKSLENLYFSNPDNWSSNDSNSNFPHSPFPFRFDFSTIKNCDKLKSLEVNYCSGLLNVQDIPISLRKLKLRTIFTLEDLTQLLKNCPYLRKIQLHNDGDFWREVSLDTVKTILEHGPCLRKVFMDHFDVASVQEYCEGREDLRLTVLKRNKGRLKIRRGNFEKKKSTSSNIQAKTSTNSNSNPSSSFSSSSSSNSNSMGDGENSENEKVVEVQEQEEQQQNHGTCSNSNSNSNFNSISIPNSLASEENCLQGPR